MKPFRENEYKNYDVSVFGNPSKEIKEIVSLLPENAKVLDVGCGDGKHLLFFANLGYQVDAFDISENGIKKINYLIDKYNLNINTSICDILEYEFNHGVLQFIAEDKHPLIIELQKNGQIQNYYKD